MPLMVARHLKARAGWVYLLPTACMSGGPDLANDGSVGAADGCSLLTHRAPSGGGSRTPTGGLAGVVSAPQACCLTLAWHPKPIRKRSHPTIRTYRSLQTESEGRPPPECSPFQPEMPWAVLPVSVCSRLRPPEMKAMLPKSRFSSSSS